MRKGTRLDGTGIASQQFRAMLADTEKLVMNQSAAYDADLGRYIMHMQQQGHSMCITMDANTWTTPKEMENFMAETGLVNA